MVAAPPMLDMSACKGGGGGGGRRRQHARGTAMGSLRDGDSRPGLIGKMLVNQYKSEANPNR